MKIDAFKDYKDLKISLSYVLLFILVSISYFPIFQNIYFLGLHDFDYNFFTRSVSVDAIKKFGEMPLMNFFDQGGVPLLATPFSQSLSPFNLLYFIFDNIVALKIEIYLHSLIGTIGMFLLLRDYKFRNDISLCISLLFGLNSYHALNIAQGQYEFLPAFFIPLVLLFLRKKQLLFFILSLTTMFLGGGVYLLAMLGVLFALLSIGSLKNLKFIALGVIGTMLLSAIKFFPTIDYMGNHPRVINDYSGFSLGSLFHSLVNQDQFIFKSHDLTVFREYMKKLLFITDDPSFYTGMDYGWDENGMYIGWFFLICLIASIGFNLWKRKLIPEILISVVALLISFGDRITPSLWGLLKWFQPFESMRHSTRFRVIFLVFICILIAAILNKLLEKRSALIKLGGGTLLLALTMITIGKLNHSIISQSFIIEPIKKTSTDEFHYIKEWKKNKSYAESHEQGYYPAYLNNKGVSYNKENHSVNVAVVNKESAHYLGEVLYFIDNDFFGRKSELNTISRTSSKLSVATNKLGKYSINHNYLKGWKCEPNCIVTNDNGLVSFTVRERGEKLISYDPISFKFGLWVTILTILFIGILKNSTTRKPFEKIIKIIT